MKKTIGCLALLSLFILSYLLMSCLGALYIERTVRTTRKIRVGAVIPRRFPVLVISQPKGRAPEARILLHVGLEEYLTHQDHYTFVVPPSQDARLESQVAHEVQQDRSANVFGYGSFEAIRLPQGRQLIKVSGTWDYDTVNVGWYFADSKSIEPLYYLWYRNSTVYAVGALYGAGANVVLWAVVLQLWRRRRSRRQAA